MSEIMFPVLPPRWYQLPAVRALDQGVKRLTYTWPRRHGKDVLMLLIFIREAMKRAGNYWYLFPTRAWAERAIWDNTQTIMVNGVEKTGKLIDICLGGLPVVKSEKNLSVRFPNGSLIRFSGTDDLSFVGQGGYGYGISEDSIHRPDVTSYISPILEEANAWLIRQGTLRGKQNHLYKAIVNGFQSEDVFTQWLTPELSKAYCWVGGKVSVNPELLGKTNPLTGRKYLNVQNLVDIGEISYALAYREYLNRASNNTEDGYYSNEYEIAKNEGRLGTGEYNKDLPVYTFWDLGKGTAAKCTDAMAVWFVQFPHNDLPKPSTIRLIAFEETRGGVWADHATSLRERGWEYGGHYMPWDINKGAAGVSGSNLQWAKEAGITFTPVQRRGNGIMSAIEICRRLWGKLEFVAGTANDGAERLSEYHEKKDNEGQYTGAPEHDSWSSNVADAYRCMVEALDKNIVRFNPPADATQGNTAVEVRSMSRAGGNKPVEKKPMLCSKGEGKTQKTLADIKRIRNDKRNQKWKR